MYHSYHPQDLKRLQRLLFALPCTRYHVNFHPIRTERPGLPIFPMTTKTPRRTAAAFGLVPPLLTLGACAGMESRSRPRPHRRRPSAAPAPATIAPYLDTLANMAPGDPTRQQAELAAALASARQSPTAANKLRYALALGAAGHKDSNPVEAKRLLADLLAGPNDLSTQELELANAYLREFDARVALYAELARQREDVAAEAQVERQQRDEARRRACG